MICWNEAKRNDTKIYQNDNKNDTKTYENMPGKTLAQMNEAK